MTARSSSRCHARGQRGADEGDEGAARGVAGEAGPLNLGVDCMRVFLSPSYSRPTRLGAPGRVRGQLAVSGALVALAKPSARGRHACLQTRACFDSLFFSVAHGSAGGTPPRSLFPMQSVCPPTRAMTEKRLPAEASAKGPGRPPAGGASAAPLSPKNETLRSGRMTRE